jgi:voltage-gated potassium channel Kch
VARNGNLGLPLRLVVEILEAQQSFAGYILPADGQYASELDWRIDTPAFWGNPQMNKHNTIYSVLFIVAAFFWLVGASATWTVLDDAPIRTFILTIYATLIFLAGLTLVMRLTRSPHAKLITMATNIIYLLFFPVGTAIGIYGLWKVDKQHQEEAP